MNYENTESFMGMPNHMNYFNSQDYYGYGQVGTARISPQQQYLPQSNPLDVPFARWWPSYSKVLYIIARTYDAALPNIGEATQSFFVNLSFLLPNSVARRNMTVFLQMNPTVVGVLKQAVPNVFVAYPWLEKMLSKDAAAFMKTSFKNQDGQALLLYVYLLDVFMISMNNQMMRSQQLPIPILNDQRAMYDPSLITKTDWGNAFWYMLHVSALYAPQPTKDSFKHYKDLLASLQWLLPCPKCRLHLQQNIKVIDFNNCARTNEELFKCSWKLHNIVNESEGKMKLPLQYAFSLYTF